MEACVDNMESVMNAARGGVLRLELCSGLSVGGLTPTEGFVTVAKEWLKNEGFSHIKLFALIRCRDGDFLYTRQDLDAMKYDMIRLSPLVDGFVIGVLTAGGKVDSGACKFLMKDLPAAEGLEFTFHRAFDMCRDAFEAAEVILDSGFARVLTSGQERSVASGGKLIRRLNETFKGRLSFMPGGGINEQNLSGILAASGSAEFHASAKSTRESGMEFRNEKCRMGDKGDDEFNINVTSEERVRKMVQIFNDR